MEECSAIEPSVDSTLLQGCNEAAEEVLTESRAVSKGYSVAFRLTYKSRVLSN